MSDVPEVLRVTLAGNDVSFDFPSAMFLESCKMLHRIHRSKAIRSFAELYDDLAEKARQKCNEVDPDTHRPELEKLGVVMFDLVTAKEEPYATRQKSVKAGRQPEHSKGSRRRKTH